MPIITVSRMYGSGGSDVATAIARALGWSLVDNGVIDEVAARTGLTTLEVAAREERLPSLSERLVTAMAMSTQEMLSPLANAKLPPTEERLLAVTRHVIEEAASRGPVVIVGRGAHLMLGLRGDVLSVFCYAPREALIRRAMFRDALDQTQAAKRVDETNRRRRDWVKSHWGRDWGAPDTYHLCINTDALGVDGTADLVVKAAQGYFEIS
ncbi:MAG: AAA family ATPase [Gemmatimonadaceae bacterium]